MEITEPLDWLDEIEGDYKDAIQKGLAKGDPNMAKLYNELRQQRDAGEILKNLEIEIVPFRIKDVSLRKIVLEAPDNIIEEVEEALKERRRLREFGGAEEAWEDEG